jgi:hypothetical protein
VRGIYNAWREREKYVYTTLWIENLKRRDHLINLGGCSTVILKCISENQGLNFQFSQKDQTQRSNLTESSGDTRLPINQ